MRYWSFEKMGVVENGVLIHTQEEIEDYKCTRNSLREILKRANSRNITS